MVPRVALQPVSGSPLVGARSARPSRFTALPMLISMAALLGSALAGRLLTRNIQLGLGLVAGCGFVTLVLLDLRLAIVAWIPLVWVEYSWLPGIAPTIATGLLVVAWLGTRRARGTALPPSGGADGRTVMLALGVLLVWLTLSMAWASDRAPGWREAERWYLAAAGFIVVATVMASRRHVRLVALAFVVGALVSIVVGLTGAGGLTTTANALDLATRQRFSGGAGDPNFLAAGLVPAIALAAGLLPSTRDPLAKVGLGAAIVAMAVATAATESRGGLIAALAALVASVALVRGRRVQAVVFGVFVIAAAGAFFLASPSALERATNFNAGGTGRSDLWTVARRMAGDHPIAGVGLAGFQTEARNYVRQPGSLQFVHIIVDEPHVAHEMYLQQLAETGIVGLALLLAVIGACVAAAGRAARRFDARGDPALATLARATLVAMIGFLTASLFISDSTDKRLWIVLALGPALLGAARDTAAPEAATAPVQAAPSRTER
jgi:O-antigen ligase